MNGKAKLVRVSWMAGALLPLLAGITSAANINSTAPQTNHPMQHDQQVATPSEQTPQFQPHLEKAKDLLGAKVVNGQGEQLGKIEEVVLTPDRSGINYLVVSHGGGLGVAEKYFAVPWSQFQPGPGENGKTFILKGNISKADLDRAPGFDKNHWPAMASENWLASTPSSGMAASGPAPSMTAPGNEGTATLPQPQSYADRGMRGETGYGTAQPMDIQSLRLSKLMGATIRDLQNEDIGKLDSVMIDLHQGKLAYGIVAMRHGFLGLSKDFVAVPWSALNWTSQPGIARLDADRDTLTALAFNRDNFPNLEDLQYSRQLYERFHVTPYWESQTLGFVPGEENKSGNLPSSEMTPPDSGMTAPNTTAPNSAAPQMVSYDPEGKHASPYKYNPNTVETIHGTVTKVATHRMKDTGTEELALTVKADNGKTVRVFVGPRSFVDRQNIIFREGDPVTITGSLVKAHEHHVLVASRIQTPNRTLDLRTSEGKPLWDQAQARAPSTYGGSSGQSQYPYRY